MHNRINHEIKKAPQNTNQQLLLKDDMTHSLVYIKAVLCALTFFTFMIVQELLDSIRDIGSPLLESSYI